MNDTDLDQPRGQGAGQGPLRPTPGRRRRITRIDGGYGVKVNLAPPPARTPTFPTPSTASPSASR